MTWQDAGDDGGIVDLLLGVTNSIGGYRKMGVVKRVVRIAWLVLVGLWVVWIGMQLGIAIGEAIREDWQPPCVSERWPSATFCE